jgi:queuine tRNA-ribosyltransferase
MTSGFSFRVVARLGRARAGVITTPRGTIETPIFMPVGTAGTVKGLTVGELAAPPLDARIILGNTYHLYLRPGLDVVRLCGGLHKMMAWNRPILTDSGGFQVFSLSGQKGLPLVSIDDDGVTFRSHIDGSSHRFSPETSIQIQAILGSDIAMAFDQCPPGDASRDVVLAAMARTTSWAKRCLAVPRAPGQALFGIVQGGTDVELRRQHLGELGGLDFDGLAIGGLSVGEPIPEMYRVLEELVGELPRDRPRYLMGVGTPEDLRQAIACGVDMFDCVMPTRNARNGQLFTSQGKVVISNARYRLDPSPVEAGCPCETCQLYSRAYLRHLYLAKEILYNRLATLHNLTYYLRLVREVRAHIITRGETLTAVGSGDTNPRL